MGVLIGIALYSQTDDRGRPTSPHWAIVGHQTSYFDEGARIYQICLGSHRTWVLKPKTCRITDARALLGVIHVGEWQGATVEDLDRYAVQYPATKNGNDPSGLIGWGCAAWVIRFIWGLVSHRRISMHCHVTQIYDIVMERKRDIDQLRSRQPGTAPLVPFHHF
jgi:hypothetical protein